MTFRTTAFVAVVCFALVALDCWNSWHSRQAELQQMEAAASNLARAMAQHADDAIKKTDIMLVGMVERIEHDGTDSAAISRLRKMLANYVAELPQLDALHIYDSEGNWVANSRNTPPQNLNNAGREYFVFHRTHEDRGPHIGVPVRSRTNGKLLIPVSRRINDADGRFAGVALATIDIDFFNRFYTSLDIGEAGAVALVSESGTMMTRRPFGDAMVGRDMRETELFRAYLAQGPAAVAYIESAQDGVTRLNSFRRLAHYPLFVAAALSKNEILAVWWRDTLRHTAGVLFLMSIIGLVGWRLIKQMELRSKTEAQLRRARDALETLNATLNTLAMEDGLTGLANRRQFDVTLDSEFRRAAREASTLALILIDVDCFKQYNDIYGHAAGDECLRSIGRIIADLAARRPGDLAARYGGEEMAVLLPNTEVANAASLAERIRLAVRDLQIVHAGTTEGFVTLSAGVEACTPEPAQGHPKELIEAADMALYAAKAQGRNRVCTARPLNFDLAAAPHAPWPAS
ncbi:diguanylate cyclase (GGDEF)-like protein [Variovorax boronicumulans]|uniref:diguanylate cyclase n=1 Tax=Variovorax boronicumulans TaxID=436515 RepID=A0AAW8DUP3_9BURK|nr:diguanylate cyclase [Variovorax boronicumulans]MDP9877754.1 diguanylate cyclase (GGDEF)-like protein [Variovorax boronicumulans]MDP9923037.1 diguanylate cyclase (GGDEF)-like protein [Variovorax boronicumulans]